MGSIKGYVVQIINQLQLITFASEVNRREMILAAVALIEGILAQIKATVG